MKRAELLVAINMPGSNCPEPETRPDLEAYYPFAAACVTNFPTFAETCGSRGDSEELNKSVRTVMTRLDNELCAPQTRLSCAKRNPLHDAEMDTTEVLSTMVLLYLSKRGQVV